MSLAHLFGGNDDDESNAFSGGSTWSDIPSLIEAKASQYGVPVEIALALVNQESGGDTNARSPKGALGLGQLMPDTAKRFGVTDPRDPEQNVDASMRYLKTLHEEFGSWDVTLAGYHAGEGNVRKAGGRIPNTSDGLIRTPQYVASILAKAERIAAERGGSTIQDDRSPFQVLFGDTEMPEAPQASSEGGTSLLSSTPGMEEVRADMAGRQSWYQRLPTMASKGAASMIEGIGWLVGQEGMENFGRAKKEELLALQMKDPEMRDALVALSEAEGFLGTIKTLAKEPMAVVDIVVGSAVQMLPGLPIAKAAGILGSVGYNVAKAGGMADDVAMAVGRKTAEKWAARAAASATEGVIASGQTGVEVEEFLIEKGMDPTEARNVALEAAAKVAASTAILSSFGSGKLEADVMTGNVLDKGIKGAARNIGVPGLEEMAQEGFEEYFGVTAKREAAPDEPMDIGKAAATGLVAGVATAAPLHAAGRMTAPPDAAPQPEINPNVPPVAEEPPKRPSELITSVDANAAMQQLDQAQSVDEAIAIFQAVNKTDINITGGMSIEQMTQADAVKAAADSGAIMALMNRVDESLRPSIVQDASIVSAAEGRVPDTTRQAAIERLHRQLTEAGVLDEVQQQRQAKALEGTLEDKVAIADATKMMGTAVFQQYAANQPENVRAAIDATAQALANPQLAESVRAEQATRVLNFAKKNQLAPQAATSQATTKENEILEGAPEMLATNQVQVARAASSPEFAAALKSADTKVRGDVQSAVTDVSNPSLPAGYRNVRAAVVMQFAEKAGIATAPADASTAPATATGTAQPSNPSEVLSRASLGPQHGIVTLVDPTKLDRDSIATMSGGQIPPGQARMLQVLGRALGRNVAFFEQKNNTGKADGFVVSSSPDTIFLNAETTRGAAAVFGHEFLHTMPQDLRQEFIDAITPLLSTQDVAKLKSYTNQPGLGDAATYEEIAADIFGNGFNRPDLIAQALDGMASPTAAMKLFQHVRAFLARMIEALGQATGFDTGELVTDLEAADKAWVKAMQKYLQRESTGKATIDGRPADAVSMEELSALVTGKTPQAERAEMEINRRQREDEKAQAKAERKSTYEDADATDKLEKAAGKDNFKGWPQPAEKEQSDQKVISPKSDLVAQQLAARKKRDSGQLMTAAELYLADSADVQPKPDAEITLDTSFSVQRQRPEEMSTRVPNGKDTTLNAVKDFLVAGLEAMKEKTKSFHINVDAITRYENYRPTESANTPEKQAERFIRHAVDNLLWLHDQMPAETRERAKLWYDGARDITDRWSTAYNLKDHQIAGVLAVLSPQKDWYMNVSMGKRVLDTMTNQKNFMWSAAMERTASRIYGQPKYAPDVEAIRDKTLGELKDTYHKAMWIRAYDEAHNSRSYSIISPEGQEVGAAMTVKGVEAKVAWGSLPSIEKAVSIIENPSLANVSAQLGEQHKVRNFYNNILVPESKSGHVTIDTHAVAAALLKPLSGESREVKHNFGSNLKGDDFGPSSAKVSGAKGTYGLYAEAYRRAAKERGLLPRELQSITWEAVRGLFRPSFKSQQDNLDAVDAVWNRYRKGQLSHENARQETLRIAGEITAPTWDGPGIVEDEGAGSADDAGNVSGDGVSGRSAESAAGGTGSGAADAVSGTDAGGVNLSVERTSIMFEVAPDPNNVALTAQWNALSNADKVAVSERVANQLIPKMLRTIGVTGEMKSQLGGYLGETNPSFAIQLPDTATPGQVERAAKMAGYMLSQDSMMVVTPKQMTGADAVGIITVQLPSNASPELVADIYRQIYEIEDGALQGHTTVDGTMALVDFSGRSKELAALVNEKLNDAYAVDAHDGYAAFIEKKDYDYATENPSSRDAAATGSPLRNAANRLRTEAAGLLEAELGTTRLSDGRGAGYSDGRLGRVRSQEAVSIKPQQPDAAAPFIGVHYGRTAGLDTLSGDQNGTGISGAEARRLQWSKDERIKRRVYFYPDTGTDTLPTKEGGLGNNVYAAKLGNLYDFRKDPAGILPRIRDIRDRQDQANAMESAVVDAGYDGYANAQMAVVLDADVPVTELTGDTKLSSAPSLGDLTPAQAAAATRVLGKPPTIAERANQFKADWKKNLVQGIFDQFAPIKELSHKAYVLARMTRGGDSTLEAMLLYGKVFVDKDGFYDVEYDKAKGMNGFAKVMQQLDGEQDRFLLWVAAQRAGNLKAIGLENLFSAADIAALKTLNQGQTSSGKSRQTTYVKALKEMMDFNESVLKIAADSGLIDPATVAMYAATPYVPFYRLQEDGVTGFGVSKGLVNQEAWTRLKGGTAQLNQDLLANMLQNWSHLITASAKNRASRETLSQAQTLGIAQQVPNSTTGKGLARYKDNGRDVTYVVGDEHLLDAILGLESASLGAWAKPFVAMKRYLTFGVTVNPTFKIRNLMRDTLTAIGTSDMSYNPIENIGKGWGLTAHDSETRAKMLASGGMIRFGSIMDGNDTSAARRMFESGLNPKSLLNSKDASNAVMRQIGKAWDAYQEFGDRGEQVNRAALYQQMVDKGMSHGEAAFWARDLMDFSSHGKWAAIRTLTQLVPFMNARLQGLYKLGRAAANDYRRLGITAASVALSSIGLMLAYKDDDDWKKREDYDRHNYWWFKIGDQAYRIPKPFEIGAIGTIAELGLQAFVDDEMHGERFARNVADLVGNQLAMNPIPQAVKPLIDLYANKDSFTGRPIETMGMDRLESQDRYTAHTTDVARLIGRAGILSPVQVDHLANAYFAWLGTMTTTVLDYGIRPMIGDRGERPAMRLKDVFLAGNFVENLPTANSRYVSQMYEQANDIEQAYMSYRNAQKLGNPERAQDILEDNPNVVRDYRVVSRIKRENARIGRLMQQVANSRTLSPETKRNMLDSYAQQRDRIARSTQLSSDEDED